MTIKIDLPESHVVTKGPRDKSWIASVTVDVTKLSPEIVAKLAVHGLQQKIADAASAAKTQDEALADMQKAVDAVLKGEWSSRGAGGGVDERTSVARSIMRSAAKARFGAKSAEWATFTGLDDAAQAAKLDEWFAANADALAGEVDAEMAARAKRREAKAGLAGKVDIAL